jgi:hypothetical protein
MPLEAATLTFFQFVFIAGFEVTFHAGGVLLACCAGVSDSGLAMLAYKMRNASPCIDAVHVFLPIRRSAVLLDTEREPRRFVLGIRCGKGIHTRSWDLQRVMHSNVSATTQSRSPDLALMTSGSKAKVLSSDAGKSNEL